MRTLSMDVSAVSSRNTREILVALIKGLGYCCESSDRFWDSFAGESSGIPEGMLVLGDLSAIATRYAQFHPHEWIARVRERKPYFVGLIRTRLDEQYIGVTDDLVRNSDMRATVCHDVKRDLPSCLVRAAAALEPQAIIDVRYSSLTRQLWVQFSDGFFGLVLWGRLGLRSEVENLMLQTATVGDHGAAVEIVRRDGDLFSIDARSIRNGLEAACPPGVPRAGVGDRVRSARMKAGISQSELASQTGIHQTRISRLEKGRHLPRPDTLERVATALGYTLTEFSPKDEGESMDYVLVANPGPRR